MTRAQMFMHSKTGPQSNGEERHRTAVTVVAGVIGELIIQRAVQPRGQPAVVIELQDLFRRRAQRAIADNDS